MSSYRRYPTVLVVVGVLLCGCWCTEGSSRQLRPKRPVAKAGLGDDCTTNKDQEFNICLDLVTVKIEEAVANNITCGTTLTIYPFPFLTPGLIYCIPSPPDFQDPNVDRETFDEGWMNDAYDAKETLETIIKGDYVRPFSPLATAGADASFTVPFGSESSLTWPNNTNFTVDDVYINIVADHPAPFLFEPLTSSLASALVAGAVLHTTSGNSVNGTVNATSPFLGLTCSIDLYFGGPGPVGGPEYLGYRQFEGTDTLYYILLHEMLHCLGLTVDNTDSFVESHTDGVSTVWTGKKALVEWNKIGCSGPLPMDLDTGLHFNNTCIPDELMGPDVSQESVLTTLTGGLLQDLGYEQINQRKLHKLKAKDLGGSLCGDFCPVKPRKQKGKKGARTLHANSARKPRSKRMLTGDKKFLLKDDILSVLDQGASSEQYDFFMRALYDQYIAAGKPPDATIHLLFLNEDGGFFEMKGSYNEAIAYTKKHGCKGRLC